MARLDQRRTARAVLGAAISIAALLLAFRQVDLAGAAAALAGVDVAWVVAGAVLQLLALASIAARWRLLFRQMPPLGELVNALLIAQVANTVLPLRAGVIARALVVARQARISRITVLSTVVAEKAVESLLFLLLFLAVLPGLAPQWFSRSSVGLTTAAAVLLFPVLLVVSVRQRSVRRWLEAAARRWPSRAKLVQRIHAGLDGLARLRAPRALLAIWGWSVAIAALGVLVNYTIVRALGISAPIEAALVVLVALQIGARLLPAAPLGGIGVFQYICVEALALFGVSREPALMYGFVLQFVVVVPPLVLGAVAIYRTHYSLGTLRRQQVDGVAG